MRTIECRGAQLESSIVLVIDILRARESGELLSHRVVTLCYGY